MLKNRTTILFYPSLSCQLNCSYCSYRYDLKHFAQGENKCGRSLRWFEWLALFNCFRPYHLEITGGEPFLYPDMKDLINHIPWQSQWSVTSNTLLDVSGIAPINCHSWSASYHYHSLEKFKENIRNLAEVGLKPEISLVIRPSNFREVKDSVEEFKGYIVKLIPEFAPRVDWTLGDLDRFKRLENHLVQIVKENPLKFQYETFDYCSAGSNYFVAIEDGSIYRCYSEFIRNNKLGTIFDFKPLKSDTWCGKECLGCIQDFKNDRHNEKRIITGEEIYEVNQSCTEVC